MLRIVNILLVMSSAGFAAAQATVLSNCDAADEWAGGTVVTEGMKEGAGAIRWAHGDSQQLRLQQVPADWSQYTTLAFWLRSDEATAAEFMLIIGSENDETEGMDYYSTEIKVDFTGWKQFEYILSEELGQARRPQGWGEVTGLYFTASGWDNTPDPNTVVYLDHMRLLKEEEVKGPRMTDEDFFAALDLQRPDLADVKAAVDAEDLTAAKAAFVKHLKERQQPRYYTSIADMPAPDSRPAKPNTAAADQALGLEYRITGVPLKFDGKIDWKANPTEPFDPEWTWQLGRHHWWPSLARAYWDAGDEKYVKHLVWEMRSWVEDNRMPMRVNNRRGSRWRTIECGIRLAGSWPRTFFMLLGAPAFDDDSVIMMLKSMAEQAAYLLKYPMGGNWLTMEGNGMGHVGILFPEFGAAQTWRDTAVDRLYKELDIQVYPDGAQIELTTGYHYVSLGNFLGLARIAQHNDVKLPDDYIGKLERMYAYGLWAMKPDRTLPAVNDAWNTNVPRTLQEGFELFPDRTDFQWIATNAKEGTPPEHTSHWFPWAGWAVMRSGWERDDNFLFFDVGPFGYGHQHEDKLAIIVSAYGANLIRDVGSYRYDTSPMRRYVVGPWAHSIVFVDGQTQQRRGMRETYVNEEPQTNPWFTSDTFDYCEGVYDEGFGPERELKVEHRRQVLFVKPDYWIVLDTLTPPDEAEHEYWSLFHLAGEDAAAGESSIISTLNDDKANLHLIPLGGAPVEADVVTGQEEPFLLGWIGTHGVGDKRPLPVARFRWTQAGVSRMMYVLCPSRQGEDLPATNLEPLEAGAPAFAARLRWTDGREDLIAWSTGEGDFGLDDTTFAARTAVVRKGADGATVGVIQVGR